MRNGKTMDTYQQFVELIFNSDAEQYVFFKGKESKTLCTVESVNKEIEKLKKENKRLIKTIYELNKILKGSYIKISKENKNENNENN